MGADQEDPLLGGPKKVAPPKFDLAKYMMFGADTVPRVLQKTLAECMGTFLFQFFGGLASSYGSMHKGPGQSAASGIGGSLGNGLALWLVIEMIGHVSGGHVNPAVTIGLCATGQSPFLTSVLYVVAQLAGAVAGAYTAKELLPDNYNFTPLGAYDENGVDDEMGEGKACALELIGAFLFLNVIWATACDSGSSAGKNHFAPFAIGLTITTLALCVGFFTGCAINPARAFGPAVAFGNWDHQWVYWVGPIGGAVLGSAYYKFTLATDFGKMKSS